MRLNIIKHFFKTVIVVVMIIFTLNKLYGDTGNERLSGSSSSNKAFKKPGKKKVALILTGGSARGLCHIGVISVLEEYGVPIDIIVGISMGSIVGGYYSYGYSTAEMLEIARQFSLLSLIEIDKPFLGFLSGEKLEEIFIRDVDRARIENLKKKLYIIATDLTNKKIYVFKEGPLYLAMRASSAIPGVFDPVTYQGKVLVDGGVLTNYPVDLVRKYGADIVIVSNVTVTQTMPRSRLFNRLYEVGINFVNKHRDKLNEYNLNESLNLKRILFRTLLLIESNQRVDNKLNKKNIDFMIEPVSEEIKPFDFYKVDEGYMLGRRATLKFIDKIVKKVRD